MKIFSTLGLFLWVAASAQNYSQYVNPMIGTGGHGHTYPGATVPFGMVQLSPDTRINGSWDGCSGYHYSDDVIYGFSHTHLSGTGVSDFGDIMLMPTMGAPSLDPEVYSSRFSHANELASAGFYSVKLDDDDIDVALTTSTRVGFHRYTFHKSGPANICLDLNHRDKLLMGEVRIIDEKTIEVMRRSEAWARDQYVFARIEFSRPMKITKINNNAFAPAKVTDNFFAGTVLALSLSTQVKAGEDLFVKVSLSPTGYDGAKLNATEISGWDFENVKHNAEKFWDQELSKIEVSQPNRDGLVIFYTALYHVLSQPNIAQDIDGQYRGRDNKIHLAKGFDYYSVFSLWDTFRAAHPLYTLIDKKRTADFVNTFLKQYEQGGRLPVWELASNETDCMIGYHSVSVIADAMVKGIKGFDYEKAFEAAKHSAMLDHLGLAAYKKNGLISIEDEHESVSKTLEYAYDDWCIAQMAAVIGKEEDVRYFMDRSQNWKNVFDTESGFMRARRNGGWDLPFDPREVNNNFTEGNSWQYSFFVPQDIDALVNAYGRDSQSANHWFEKKLDELFVAPSATTGREQPDITGMMGQYAHGNEPSHHVAYLYNFVGRGDKATEKVHYILKEFYKNSPEGLIGNEDCGQMSAWYVLSSLGIYQVTPGKPEWQVVKPFVEKAKVNFEDGSSDTITKNSDGNHLSKFGIKYTPENFNYQYDQRYVVPVINSKAKSFGGKTEISISSSEPSARIRYRVIQKGKLKPFKNYKKPFSINASAIVEALVEGDKKRQSHTIAAEFIRKPNDYRVELKSTYNRQYHAGGPDGLVDGIYGTENWRKGDWQGYQGQDFECIIDLKKSINISHLSADFLQDSRSWILMPTKVEYYISEDNISYSFAGSVHNTVSPKIYEIKQMKFETDITPVKAKFIKVVAKSFGKLPEWHQGFGGDAFIFIDEIQIH